MSDIEKDGTTAPHFTAVLDALYRHSPYMILRKFAEGRWRRTHGDATPSRSWGYRFTNRWVVGNFLCAVAGSVAIFLCSRVGGIGLALSCLIGCWAVVRSIELIVTQLHIVLVDAFKNAKVKGVQRSIVFLLLNYLELMFWFACITMALLMLFDRELPYDWGQYVSSSIFGCLTFDSDRVLDLANGDPMHWIRYLALAEALVGSLMNIISVSAFVGALPQIHEGVDRDDGERPSTRSVDDGR